MMNTKYEYKIEKLDLDDDNLDREFINEQMQQMAADGWHIASGGRKHQVWEREVLPDAPQGDAPEEAETPVAEAAEEESHPLTFDGIEKEEYYTGVPDTLSCLEIVDKVIFMVCHKKKDPECLSVRFALYCYKNGECLLQVRDNRAHCPCSYKSEKCIAIGKQEVIIDFEQRPMTVKRSTPEEQELAHRMMSSANITIEHQSFYDAHIMELHERGVLPRSLNSHFGCMPE